MKPDECFSAIGACLCHRIMEHSSREVEVEAHIDTSNFESLRSPVSRTVHSFSRCRWLSVHGKMERWILLPEANQRAVSCVTCSAVPLLTIRKPTDVLGTV